MALGKSVGKAVQAASAPEAPVDDGSITKPLFEEQTDGSEQKKDGDQTYAGITDPSTATQSNLYKFGNQAAENFNKTALSRAQSGEDYSKNMQYGSNIPVDSPFADYNNMSWDQTQRLSRLADAFNSQTHWTPGTYSVRDGSGQVGQWQQNTPIQTEEMRRGELTRQGLGQQQSYQLGRANEILSYPQQLTAAFDKMGMDADAAAMEIQRNFADYAQRAQYDQKFSAEYNQALQKGLAYWTEHFAQYEKSKVASILYNQIRDNPQYAQWVAAQMVGYPTPDGQQYLANMITSQVQRSDLAAGMKPEEIYAQVKDILGRMTGYTSWSDSYWNAKAATQSLAGGSDALRGR